MNDAPVLTAANPSMGTTDEDTATTISLATFINGRHGHDDHHRRGHATPCVGGIALIGITGNGTWAYSLDGTNFTDVGTVVRELRTAAAQRRHAALHARTARTAKRATITYRAWDTTSGTAGGRADLTPPARRRRHGLQHRHRHRLAHRHQRQRRPGPDAGQPLAGKHNGHHGRDRQL